MVAPIATWKKLWAVLVVEAAEEVAHQRAAHSLELLDDHPYTNSLKLKEYILYSRI
jgi:hypothetical protein